jgi:4'-phosphopantetheinyl transferase
MVWLTPPAAAHAEAEAWLSPHEQARLGAMQHPRARAEFLTGRWLLRGLLGLRLGCAPGEVRLALDPHGALSVPGASVGVNLSHTAGLVALALADGLAVGVDVEWTARPGRTVDLAHRYFAEVEQRELRALPEGEQRARFFALWTLKEAYIKARGLGLKVPLGSFAFRFSAAGLVLHERPDLGPTTRWRAVTTTVGSAHQLAVLWGRPDEPGAEPDDGPDEPGAEPDDGPDEPGAEPDDGPDEPGAEPDDGPDEPGAEPDDGPDEPGAEPDDGPDDQGVSSSGASGSD